MQSLLKKIIPADKNKPGTPAQLSLDAREFIPASYHYDDHTLLTKNGELMQTMRIDENVLGLNYESHDHGKNSLRDMIRSAIAQHIQHDRISIWLHVLRKRKPVAYNTKYEEPFTAYVQERWHAATGWSHQFYNEVYITLVYEGQDAQMFEHKHLKEVINSSKNRLLRNNYLEAVSRELDEVSHSIMDHLSSQYRVHRLTIAERRATDSDDVFPKESMFFSEPMEFQSYLLNLRDEPVPVPDADISAALQSSQVLFGFNAMETKSDTGIKRFGALLTLKQYREVPLYTIDSLLQAPMELIITQTFHFINADTALKQYKEQKELFECSGDDYSVKASGLSSVLEHQQKLSTDFGHHQVSFMLLANELKQLDQDIKHLQESFGMLGLVCVREDIKLEEIFWSTLPGNFEFLRRKESIPTALIGGFLRLNRFSTGNSENPFWGQPISLIPTLVKSPYFFNFHTQDNGHTLWLDCNSFDDTHGEVALYFLLTQAFKVKPKLYLFDQHESAKLLFNTIGLPYHSLGKTPHHSINPFSLDATPQNMGFLTAWCSELIDATAGEREVLRSEITQYFSSPQPHHFQGFLNFVRRDAASLAERFSAWEKDPMLGSKDMDRPTTQSHALDLTTLRSTPKKAAAMLAYQLQCIIQNLTGAPTIIVLRGVCEILSQPFFHLRLESLLEMLKENNAMVIVTEKATPKTLAQPSISNLYRLCGSTVIVVDEIRQDYSQMLAPMCSEGDQFLLWNMERNLGDILLKQGSESVALRIGMKGMDDISAIYSNDIKTLISAGGPYARVPQGDDT